MQIKKQLAKWYSLEFLSNFSIYGGVNILLLLSRGFTLLDFGIAEGFFHVSSLLFEVPSGMLADILGRKKILFLSQLSFALSALLMIFSKTLLGIILSYSASALAWALLSGAREAICYDSLAEYGRKNDYLKILGNGEICYQVSGIVGNLCSGIALRIGYVLSYTSKIVTSLSSAGLALSLREPKVSASRMQKFSLRVLGRNFKQQFKGSVLFLRHTPRAARIMFSTALAACVRTLITFYMQDLLSSNGAVEDMIGFYIIGISLGSILGAKIAPLFEKHLAFSRRLLFCTLGIAAGALLAASTPSLLTIAAGCFIVFFFEVILALNASAVLNHIFASDKRATLVGVSSMIFSIYMLPASPLTGWIADHYGMGAAFYCLAGLLLVLAAGIAVYLLSWKKKEQA